MLVGRFLLKPTLVWILVITLVVSRTDAACCVWRVTGPNGGTLYLGGSVHALQSTDYPLPSAYNRAFDASTRLVLEADPTALSREFKEFLKAGQYPKGDTLKNHVDPRTYDYLRRFFALWHVPEQEFRRFRPWYIEMKLSSPPLQYWLLGVEPFLIKRAYANSKPITGLESLKEGVELFSGLSDRESEALLLILFINAARDKSADNILNAWRRGDADSLWQIARQQFRDYPEFEEREVNARSRNWIPKIESYMRSGQTYFVVVGAGHMGGPQGLLALLRARGCKLEQL
jgi:uncharacterized protein YbaP (TraB family)